jgi:hypothetical protein
MNLTDIISTFEETENIYVPDLTDKTHNHIINELSDKLYKHADSSDELTALENRLLKAKKVYSLFSHSALKIAKSKKLLSELKGKIHITVVFAMFKEHKRILKKEDYEHGEDFLLVKAEQMDMLTKDFENISWNMILVDDGCPEKSGEIAEKLIKDSYHGNNIEVLYLRDAIDKKLDVVKNLKHADDSRKGGSILYGMWKAVQKKYENHIVMYTDADLSTHLGQSGLLIHSILSNGTYAAIGSRREVESVVVKSDARDLRGKLFIYVWKRMLRRLNYIVDSQCGFKAFKADIVEELINDNIEYKFAFDLELILKTDLLKRLSVDKIPIAWIDSDDESTTTDIRPYLPMLKSIAKMYHKYLPANAEAHQFAFFIKDMTEHQWSILVENVPEGIQIKSAIHYDIYDEIKVRDFEEILEKHA